MKMFLKWKGYLNNPQPVLETNTVYIWIDNELSEYTNIAEYNKNVFSC